jgi:predicted flap endonuclease-1-like 5' DNA nuclease
MMLHIQPFYRGNQVSILDCVVYDEDRMTVQLLDIDDIGTTYARTLARLGLTDTDQLLKSAGSAQGRKKLAMATGISETLIHRWVNRADLLRVEGIGAQYADLLEELGVDTVRELSTRVPEKLQMQIAAINEAKKLASRTPTVRDVQAWVAVAKSLLGPNGAAAHGVVESDLFWPSPDLEQLAVEQDVRPIRSLADFASDAFTEDEADEIIAELRAIRS